MRRIWICLLALLVLAGCGEQETDAGEPPAEQETSSGSFSLELDTEWDVYDPSAEEIWCILSYEGEGDPLEFGAEYRLEVQTDSGWEQVPFVEGTGWDSVLYTLHVGESWAFPCVLSLFDYSFTDGTYRVVKEIGDQTLTAEFTLTDGAAISAETPYGFGPMEDLPEDWDTAEAAASGAVVFTEAGVENSDAAATFLEKVSLGIPCQLRTLQNYYESWPMLIDVIYENDSFRWRMRTGGELTEKRFSYIVTDGTDVYLSNGADWDSTERYDSDKAFLLPSGSGGDLVPRAQELMADQTAGSTVRYRIWSADGVWDASLTETPTEFGVGWQRPGEGSSGSLYDLGDWYDEAPAITDIAWQADGTLRLTCRLEAGGVQTFDFDPETGYLTEALCGYPAAE
nr:immunoglobulin-like domain-containing protein [uncultured Oscillibacter sp.]